MDASDPPWEKSKHRYWIVLILLVSILLRWLLIFQGGQYFFSDEARYQTSHRMAELLLQGKVWEAGLQLFSTPEHLGYKVIGIIPALLERIISPSLVLPALFFSLFSVLNLYLMYLLAKQTGGSPGEALFALTFAALSQCLFFYSRHFMPYDVAMSFGLVALHVGLADSRSPGLSILCGFLSLLCFVTYNGYWTLAALALLVHVVRKIQPIQEAVGRAVFLGIGFSFPLFAFMAFSAQLGINLLEEYSRFAATITEGNYAEGWNLPFAYLWHTEHFLFVALAALALYAMLRGRNRQAVVLWAGCVLFIYLCLALPSFFFQSFVVYGRLVRQIMPFLILLAANGLISLSQGVQDGQRLVLAVLLAVVIQAAWNFNLTFHVNFPRDFVREVQADYRDFNFSPKRFAFGAPEICENNGYAIQNAKFFLAAPESLPAVSGDVLLAVPHPINFLPYQYEGYTPEQRQAFRQAELRMVFYKLDPEFAETEDLKKLGILSCLTR